MEQKAQFHEKNYLEDYCSEIYFHMPNQAIKGNKRKLFLKEYFNQK